MQHPASLGADANNSDIRVYSFWRTVETVIYAAAAGVIAISALIVLVDCVVALWQGLRIWNSWNAMLHVIDGLLLVLMLVEILHTVRISIRSHVMVAEPFLVVGLIASIRRILVIGLEAGNLSRSDAWSKEQETIFRASILELGLLGVLVLILVASIWLLRRSQAAPEEA